MQRRVLAGLVLVVMLGVLFVPAQAVSAQEPGIPQGYGFVKVRLSAYNYGQYRDGYNGRRVGGEILVPTQKGYTAQCELPNDCWWPLNYQAEFGWSNNVIYGRFNLWPYSDPNPGKKLYCTGNQITRDWSCVYVDPRAVLQGWTEPVKLPPIAKGITPPSAPAQTTYYYTVRTNDTLSKIAGMYGTTVDQIVVWNNIQNRDVIYVGQRLIVGCK